MTSEDFELAISHVEECQDDCCTDQFSRPASEIDQISDRPTDPISDRRDSQQQASRMMRNLERENLEVSDW